MDQRKFKKDLRRRYREIKRLINQMEGQIKNISEYPWHAIPVQISKIEKKLHDMRNKTHEYLNEKEKKEQSILTDG